MKRIGAGLACLAGGAVCLTAEFLWVSGPREEHFGLPPAAARALVFLLGLTGMLLLYAGFRLLRKR